jgi:hypothetical protein
MNESQTKVFAFVVDGDVVATFHIPNVAPNHERLWAGLSSNPTVIESTDTPGVDFGWTFDGQNFIAPAGE